MKLDMEKAARGKPASGSTGASGGIRGDANTMGEMKGNLGELRSAKEKGKGVSGGKTRKRK